MPRIDETRPFIPVRIAVLPTPKQVRMGDGAFVVTAQTPIRVVGTSDTTATNLLQRELVATAGVSRGAIAQGQLPPPKQLGLEPKP